MQYAIETKCLCKSFGQKHVLRDITIAVPTHGLVGLLGRNGAGKTTLLAMLMGLLKPTKGYAYILGKSMPASRCNIAHRINFCSPYLHLPSRLSVWENLYVYAELYGTDNSKKRIGELSETLYLQPLLKRETGTLSAGERSRVNFAKALLNKPDLLFLDEPTASMDPVSADILRGTLENYILESGASVLLASHSHEEIQRLCSSLIIISNGKAVETGAIQQTLKRMRCRSLSDLYEIESLEEELVNTNQV